MVMIEYGYAQDLMHEVSILNPGDSVKMAADVMNEKDVGSVLVKIEDDGYGIVTERDIVKKIVSPGLDPESVKLDEVMTSPIESIESDADLHQIAEKFSEKNIRRLPVIEEGNVVGMITTRDISKTLIPSLLGGD